ncbi:NAD(+) kinase [Lobaria immixta]|nr:NAD(+) kinase [Lobaria immixta]
MPAHIHSVDDMGEGKKCASLSDALLRDYATNLDPLNTNASSYRDDDTRETMSNASTQVNNSPQDLTAQLPLAPAVLPGRASQSFRAHRKGTLSTDSIPRPTIMKSLNSPPPSNGHHPSLSLNAALSSRPNAKEYETENQYPKASAQHLSTTLSDLKLSARTPAMARFASLQSPCYFHQRFDDAVNIDRVLEEIAADENGMSHSRLIQTATSVREISKQLQRRPIKRAVRSIMIITKARDNSLVYLTRELTEWLLKTPRYNSYLGVTVYVDAKLRTSKRFNAASLLASNPGYERMLKYWTPDLCYKSPEKFDLVLTLGGDGTVLFTSWLFQRIVPPVLSFSLGSLGFLTNFEFSSYKTHLDRIMGDHGMRVNLRMRFTCTIIRAANRGRASQPPKTQQTLIPGGQNNDRDGNDSCGTNTDSIEDEQFEVLNELVIDRGPSPYVSNLELYGDNELLTVVQADGCIISTPTGSTAYSLSAGGPLTHPSIPGIVLTPICPHTLSFRPMVLSDTLLLRICVPRSSRSTAYASFDGKGRVELRRGDCVQVEAGKYPFPTVVGEGGTGGEWFESVRRALRWNNRGAVQKAFGGGAESAAKQTADVGADVELDEEEGEEEEEWDIDADPIDMGGSVDSGIWLSEGSSTSASPGRRKEPRTGLMGASGCSSVPWRSMKLVS